MNPKKRTAAALIFLVAAVLFTAACKNEGSSTAYSTSTASASAVPDGNVERGAQYD